MAVSSYRQLVVWQKAIGLVLEVYRATQDFPKEEMYGLTSQLRRAAVSVPSNIAEGQGRFSTGESNSSSVMQRAPCSSCRRRR